LSERPHQNGWLVKWYRTSIFDGELSLSCARSTCSWQVNHPLMWVNQNVY